MFIDGFLSLMALWFIICLYKLYKIDRAMTKSINGDK